MANGMARLLIVGGGFAGATAAVQAARRSPAPLDITVVEPDAELGRGLAYRGDDPDHRVNGPMFTHSIDPVDTDHIVRWAARTRLLDADPQASCADGVFLRRGDYGRYLHEAVLEHAQANPSGSRITHRRARVVGLRVDSQRVDAQLDDGQTLQAEASLLAIGNPPARLPPMLRDIVGHRALVTEPLLSGRLRELPRHEPVAVMGTSLTAADVLATLIRLGHRGPITAFSRRGLRPHRQRPPDPAAHRLGPGWLIERINGAVPPYLTPPAGQPQTVRHLVRVLRRRIAELTSAGQPWQAGFDELRDVVWQVWPQLDDAQKRRFIRQVRVWYDVARFRMPPQTAGMLDPVVASGQLRFVAQSLRRIEVLDDRHLRLHLERAGNALHQDVAGFINCTGLDMGGAVDPRSLPGRLLDEGVLARDGSGFGYRVDARCRPIGQGRATPDRLRLIGPITAGVFGDTLGAMFIAVQVHRLLPDLFDTLQVSSHP